jgi:hypothetical protein
MTPKKSSSPNELADIHEQKRTGESFVKVQSLVIAQWVSLTERPDP